LVGGGIADFLEIVEMTVSVARLTFGGLAEVAGDLGVALYVGDLREIEISGWISC